MKSPMSSKLPVDDILPRLLSALEVSPCAVLQAAPGTGKTTRVPPALLRATWRKPSDEILVLEPRRLAAKLSARRVAQERGEAVGQTIGYQFRFENVSSAATRVRFLTEGMLMRRLIGDRELKGVAAVVLDEFHERHLHSDVALSYLRWLQRGARPDLRLVVMSATLDTQSLSVFLGDQRGPAPILNVEGRQFEVTLEHLPQAPTKHLDLTVRDAVSGCLAKTKGDFLVFLPGMAEIRRSAQALESLARDKGLMVTPLHGELSREEQDLALKPGQDRRKVILSTNIAETSLTIEGVTVVIDSGLHRVASHSWWSGVPSLRTRPISRASAIQRAGRAGRMAPGHCLRLYTRGDFDGRAPFDTPEIQRADLTQTLLELKSLGISDLLSFGWFESPAAQAVDASRGLLFRLGALDSATADGALTSLGRRLATLPAHPRVGRMLIEAEAAGVLEEAATLAAYLMESKLEGLDALSVLRQGRMEESVWRVRTHLLAAFGRRESPSENPRVEAHSHVSPAARLEKSKRLAFCLLCGFPDRIARMRVGQDPTAKELELVLSAGGSARVVNTGEFGKLETFIVLGIQERQGTGQVRAATQVQTLCAIDPDWLLDLNPSPLSEVDELTWDKTRERVMGVSRLMIDQCVLSETALSGEVPGTLQAQAARLLLKEGLGIDPGRMRELNYQDLARALAPIVDGEAVEFLWGRLALVSKHLPEAGLADFSEAHAAVDCVLRILGAKTSLRELRETDWISEIILASGLLPSFSLDELVPTHVTLSAGRRVKVHYTLGQPPWIESRMQDFFGMKRGPSILRGRLPLTLHLLAPNQRAVQVTTDLAGFWERAYPELRGQLSRCYPRHSWPEKPQ